MRVQLGRPRPSHRVQRPASSGLRVALPCVVERELLRVGVIAEEERRGVADFVVQRAQDFGANRLDLAPEVRLHAVDHEIRADPKQAVRRVDGGAWVGDAEHAAERVELEVEGRANGAPPPNFLVGCEHDFVHAREDARANALHVEEVLEARANGCDVFGISLHGPGDALHELASARQIAHVPIQEPRVKLRDVFGDQCLRARRDGGAL